MRIVALFNLREGVDPAAYEDWAQATDLPTVRGLPSVAGFHVLAATGVLGSDAAPPYAYVEIIEVADMDRFGRDVAGETVQRVAAEFRDFADDPVFLLTREVGAP